MPDHIRDYALDDKLEVDTAEGLKALSHPTRSSILDMLVERSASITQLADALGRPKGSVGHHVKALEEAGLIRVVRTRKVRAMTEKFYGRTARWFVMRSFEVKGVDPGWHVNEALESIDRDLDAPHLLSARYARIRAEDAERFSAELVELLDRFLATERGGDIVYAMVAGVFATTRPHLPASSDADGGEGGTDGDAEPSRDGPSRSSKSEAAEREPR